MSFLSYTLIYILHPILHPKLSVNSESLRQGVGNVVFFYKTFFWGAGMQKWAVYWIESRMEIENIGLL